jgi:hypothetical protein
MIRPYLTKISNTLQETGIYRSKIFIVCFFLPVIIVVRSAWNKILLDKLPFCKLVSKFPAVYGTRIKRILFTGTRHWWLSSSRDNIGDGWLEVRENIDGLV